MKINDLNKHNILHASKIGWEIEFIPKQSVNETRKILQKKIGKKIQYFDKAHSDFKPTDEIFKIEPDYSGGEKTLELITGPLKYVESKLMLIKIFNYIKEYGKTTDRCGIHYNISFDKNIYGESFLTHMDVLKFILEFNEDYVYEIFPKRKDNVYAKSIKFIIPQHKYFLESNFDFENISPKSFILPHAKYYGVNFTKLIKGYLEFRYLGGKNYEQREEDIFKVINESIISLYESASNKKYTKDNIEELTKVFEKHRKLINSYKNLDSLKKEFPKLKIYTDLQNESKIVSLYYTNIRDKIFEILSEARLKQGELNYDSDKGKIQIRGANLTNCYMLKHVDLVNCKINGNIQNCNLFDCEINNSILEECKIYNSEIFNSKLKDSYIGKSCRLNNSYIYGKNSIFNAKMYGGIFREGNIGKFANISPETDVIDFKKI